MVNDERQGMTDAGAAGMSGSRHDEGPEGMQTEQPQRVEPLHFPLWGSRLIEASAGTGKTYTIAALYLRLVLGHGERGTASLDAAYPPEAGIGILEGARLSEEVTAFREALTPPKILVVTFTEAATLELRDRIRARLAEAAAFFRASAEAVEAGAGLDVMIPGSVPDQDLLVGSPRRMLPRPGMTLPYCRRPILSCRGCVMPIRPSSGPSGHVPCSWQQSGWMNPPFPPFMAGATACCVSMPSTAAGCSTRR